MTDAQIIKWLLIGAAAPTLFAVWGWLEARSLARRVEILEWARDYLLDKAAGGEE